MKLQRNKEVCTAMVLSLLVSAAAVAVAALWDKKFSIFTGALCCILTGIFWVLTRKRYRELNDLASELDRLLHGDITEISVQECCEGELSLLQSEIQKMTVRLREQQQKLQQDKTYLADSIADISHQIRTPLTSINLLLQLLCEPNITQERKRDLTRELQSMLSRIDWLITTLLKISRLDAGTVQFQKELLPMSALLNQAAEPLLVPVELRQQTLQVQAQGSFTGDLSWTREAITNILKNCMEHTPAEGTITVTGSENALYSEIIITDTGTGIAKEDLPHIFQRFYKGKNADSKSFGVGLALSRMIIVRQGGTVKAENITPHGVKFTIRFYKSAV